MLLNFLRGLGCDHEYTAHGYSGVRCMKCGYKKYAPNKAAQILTDKFNQAIESGNYSADELMRAWGRKPERSGEHRPLKNTAQL